MRWSGPVAVVALAALAAALAGSPATAAFVDGPATAAFDDRPPGATATVEIRLGADGDGGAEAPIRWAVRYPARSPDEAARAANDSLALDWFRGRQHVRAAVASHPGGRVTDVSVATQHLDAEGTDHGVILVDVRATWPDVFGGNRSRVVLGPAFADRLADGDVLSVVVHRSTEAVTASTERTGANEIHDQYWWVVGEEPTPRVVFEERAVERGVTVPGPGTALALLAVLAAALLVGTARRC